MDTTFIFHFLVELTPLRNKKKNGTQPQLSCIYKIKHQPLLDLVGYTLTW